MYRPCLQVVHVCFSLAGATTQYRATFDGAYFVMNKIHTFPCITCIIKNWIIGWCNSRVFIGLAIMGYEPLYHALQMW